MFQQIPAAVGVLGTRLSQHDFARSALKQADAEVFFQTRHMARDDGRRRAEPLRRLREAPAIGDLYKDLHGLKEIHNGTVHGKYL
ncbi:hypothetical protein GCM10011400_06790 [Paraburkholderia caffeinilytica]|uniref:Uncharacterized protein n=1 Tax=Paraburkholderia caffeinilytica TaxID=1761016 RepID=A0ABQ1LD16_9BURK|nr:hypothetical protein GCM10011400_06790 [Paraburkholderia caffeinilytica]